MKKLIVKLQNCYGISKLETDFDFSQRGTYAIYAPNGMMKTSFAKSFKDFSLGEDSRDFVFPDRKTTRVITDENDNHLNAEDIFVIEPYNEQFSSNKLSTLLVAKDLKEEYDKAYETLEKEKSNFIKKLKVTSQSTDCESEFISTFITDQEESFFELLSQTLPKLDGKRTKYTFRYNDVFDKKGSVKQFLIKHQDSLELYVQNYDSLISQSKLFKKSANTFGTYQAGEILKSVSNNSFFDAGHLLGLADSTNIHSAEDFKKLLEDEIGKVLSDNELKKIFDKVDKAIGSNVELRAFKTAIENDNLLLVELQDYEFFKKKVWLGYLDLLKSEVEILVDSYNQRKTQLENIISRAKNEKTEWERSINEFNERFKGLPFKLFMKNKEDVILKTSAPTVEFIFHDRGDEITIERDQLLRVLSQGERRALYLLNIIFEVSARRKTNKNTIFIIDDIADSFDYKNKYAIIEYLIDISKTSNFYQIILTHNFDFFRTVEGRFVNRTYCRMVTKSNGEISIVDAAYLKPFKYFKDNLGTNNKILIASIPFVRNLAEYSGHDTEFSKLTSLLHIKSDTRSLTKKDLEDVIKSILLDKANLQLTDDAKIVLDLVFDEAESILQNTDVAIELENKIVLSIAIRLKAEEFTIKAINNSTFVNSISKSQTIALINKYKELFPNEKQNIDLLEQVNLMTPENIHLNSFMYEPIIDLGIDHLKDLYSKIKLVS